MRIRLTCSARMIGSAVALASVLVFASVLLAQNNVPRPPAAQTNNGATGGGGALPKRTNGELSKANLPGSWKGLKIPPPAKYDPHDLTGVWEKAPGFHDTMTEPDPPPMTAEGKKAFDSHRPVYGPRQVVGVYGNDPVMTCDPLGMPRNLFLEVSVYDMAFAQGLPGREMQFFEWQHVFRNIWTDGRKLPTDAEPTWNGYSIGHWEGNTFVVETNGLDDTGRTWIDHFGNPIDGNAKIIERYTRPDLNTLKYTIEIDDPTMYTAKWVSNPRTLNLVPDGDFEEIFCVPSEEESFNRGIRDAAGGVNVHGIGSGEVSK
jgi:hypothetical protein